LIEFTAIAVKGLGRNVSILAGAVGASQYLPVSATRQVAVRGWFTSLSDCHQVNDANRFTAVFAGERYRVPRLSDVQSSNHAFRHRDGLAGSLGSPL
jgi:hypothetical protein